VDSTIKQGIKKENYNWKCSYYTNERLLLYFSLHLTPRYNWNNSKVGVKH